MGFFLVLKAEIVRGMIVMRRYWFASLTGIFIGYGMLLMLIQALMYGRGHIEDMAEQAVDGGLGFIIGIFAFGIVGLFTQGLQGMARTGELEQVCMSPHGLVTNFLARSLVAAVSSIVSLSIIIALIAWSVEGTLHFAPLPTVLLLALTYLNLIGFGFMVGGLVLIFKQTGQIAMIIRLAMIGLAFPAQESLEGWPISLRVIVHVLPVTNASICLKEVLIDGAGWAVFENYAFYFLILSCLLWTTLGIACFRYMENWSRDKGTLGAY